VYSSVSLEVVGQFTNGYEYGCRVADHLQLIAGCVRLLLMMKHITCKLLLQGQQLLLRSFAHAATSGD
jgi:hypothetical protein